MVFEEKHHMLWAYDAYEVQELNFRESVGNAFHRCGLLPPSADSFHRLRTPSTAYSFHRRGRSPSLEEGGLGVSPGKACGLAVEST